jgi:hypothetical protein
METAQVTLESHINLQDPQLGVPHAQPTVMLDTQVKGVHPGTSLS